MYAIQEEPCFLAVQEDKMEAECPNCHFALLLALISHKVEKLPCGPSHGLELRREQQVHAGSLIVRSH
jgi:hypothetical protein